MCVIVYGEIGNGEFYNVGIRDVTIQEKLSWPTLTYLPYGKGHVIMIFDPRDWVRIHVMDLIQGWILSKGEGMRDPTNIIFEDILGFFAFIILQEIRRYLRI